MSSRRASCSLPVALGLLWLALACQPATVQDAVAAQSLDPAEVKAALSTLQRFAELAVELHLQRSEEGQFPADLAPAIVSPGGQATVQPPVDGWGTPLRYRATAAGADFRLVSPGADREFEERSDGGGDTGDLRRDLVLGANGYLGTWERRVLREAAELTRETEAVLEDRLQEQRRRRARMDLLMVGVALTGYAADHGGSYPAGATLAELDRQLVPDYAERLPGNDPWGSPYIVRIGDDRRSALVVSAGADGVAEPESWTAEGAIDELGRDAVWKDGSLVRDWAETPDVAAETELALRAYEGAAAALVELIASAADPVAATTRAAAWPLEIEILAGAERVRVASRELSFEDLAGALIERTDKFPTRAAPLKLRQGEGASVADVLRLERDLASRAHLLAPPKWSAVHLVLSAAPPAGGAIEVSAPRWQILVGPGSTIRVGDSLEPAASVPSVEDVYSWLYGVLQDSQDGIVLLVVEHPDAEGSIRADLREVFGRLDLRDVFWVDSTGVRKWSYAASAEGV